MIDEKRMKNLEKTRDIVFAIFSIIIFVYVLLVHFPSVSVQAEMWYPCVSIIFLFLLTCTLVLDGILRDYKLLAFHSFLYVVILGMSLIFLVMLTAMLLH